MALEDYLEVFRREPIARRYLVMNAFDGCLTVMGIVIAFFVSGSQDPSNVVISTIGAAVAMGASGMWGAYAIEKAERIRSLGVLERHMMKSLDGSNLRSKVDRTSMVLAAIDGLSQMAVSILMVLPFVLLPVNYAYQISLAMIGVTLFVLGAFVGKVQDGSLLLNGIKMVLAGFLVGIVIMLLEFLNVI